MPRAKRTVEQGLITKGFQLNNTHHRFFVYYDLQGAKTAVRTKTSQGGTELDDFLLGQMAKQCHLSKAQFLSLIDCPLSRIAYENILTLSSRI